MDSLNIFQQAVWINEAVEYGLDAVQRSILFTDILRRRGNNYFESVEKGLPPVLVFNYEVILDARTFDRPANYALSRIIPREGDCVDETKRPIVVIDPRAGKAAGGSIKKAISEGLIKNGIMWAATRKGIASAVRRAKSIAGPARSGGA